MTKLTLEDTMQTALMKLSEGNPGALTALMDVLNNAAQIDPDSVGGGGMVILQLDDLGIYGPRIWMLYEDVCGHSVRRMMGVLRAVQLGIIGAEVLQKAIDNRGDGLDMVATLEAVKAQLPAFQVELPDAAQA